MNHAGVGTGEFLMNFRTLQICSSCTESDNVILQQGAETIHGSTFELHFELLTNGVEHLAAILKMFMILAVMSMNF